MQYLYARLDSVGCCSLFLALLVAGCGREPSDIAKIAAIVERSNPPTVSLRDATAKFEEIHSNALELTSRLSAALESVKDESSAQSAIKELKDLGDDLDQGKFDVKGLVAVKCSESEWSEFEQLKKDRMVALKQEFDKSGPRIQSIKQSIKNAKLSFFTQRELNSAISSTVFAANSVKGPLYQRLPPADKQVIVAANNLAGAGELGPYLQYKNEIKGRTLAKEGWSIHSIFPVNEVEAFSETIDIGTVKQIDLAHRVILVDLTEDDRKKLREIKAKRIEDARIAREEAKKQQQKRMEVDRSVGIKDQIAKQKEHIEQALAVLKQMSNPVTCRDLSSRFLSHCSSFHSAKDRVKREAVTYRRFTGKDYKDLPDFTQAYADIDAQLKRIQQDLQTRAMLAKKLGTGLTAEGLLERDRSHQSPPDPAKNPDSPVYFAANLNDLTLGGHFEKREAMTRLAKANPRQCTDVEIRRGIARSIRDLAMEGRSSRDDAVDALIVWAGKYSAPILIEMLNEATSPWDKKKLVKLVAKYPTPDGASAVARLVGKFSVHESACLALVDMGAVAEDAVLKLAPHSEKKISLAAIIILGDIGTEKSLPILKKARASSNQDVKRAAKETTRKIIKRTKDDGDA